MQHILAVVGILWVLVGLLWDVFEPFVAIAFGNPVAVLLCFLIATILFTSAVIVDTIKRRGV